MSLLIYGWHACAAALCNPGRVIEQVYITDAQMAEYLPEITQFSNQVIERKNLNLRLPAGAIHQGITIQVQALPTYPIEFLKDLPSANQRVLILDQVSDPQNVGAIIRSACAFQVDAIIMTERYAPQESGALVKAACGAFEYVPRIMVNNLAQALQYLKDIGYWCYGMADSGDKYLHQLDLTGKVGLIIGSEGDGLRRLTKTLCDEIVKLHTNPEFSVLNVSNATAISLHTLYQSHFKAP